MGSNLRQKWYEWRLDIGVTGSLGAERYLYLFVTVPAQQIGPWPKPDGGEREEQRGRKGFRVQCYGYDCLLAVRAVTA